MESPKGLAMEGSSVIKKKKKEVTCGVSHVREKTKDPINSWFS